VEGGSTVLVVVVVVVLGFDDVDFDVDVARRGEEGVLVGK
jgi:hypothetical protein